MQHLKPPPPKKKLGVQAMESIENFIMTGVLRPDQRIIESDLAGRLGLSRTPLREALRQLEIKGYVTKSGNTGYVVAYHTQRDLKDIFEVRVALESKAIKLACERITEFQLDRANEYLRSSEAHIDVPSSMWKWNNLFHNEMYDASGNKILISHIQSIRDRDRIANMGRAMVASDWLAFHEQHQYILQSVQQRDKRKAEKAVKQHLATVLEVYQRSREP
jgi:DNA-binding GntR family transcriptional regulator